MRQGVIIAAFLLSEGRMGMSRSYNERWIDKPDWQLWWPGSRIGRYYKRGLSKARRRQAKEELRGQRPRSVSGYERECNWKTW